MIDEHFRATIESNGHTRKLSIGAKAYFATKLNKLPHGHKVWVHVYDKEPKRSDRQNRFYWLYLGNIAEETGATAEELHEHFKREYLLEPAKQIAIGGGKYATVQPCKSTAQLTKKDFTWYLECIERDTGIPLPDTDEFHYGTKEEQADEFRNRSDYPEQDESTLADKF